MTTVAEKYLQIAKLAKDPANAEVVIDGILTFFGLDYFDLDLGVEYLYTTKVIDYKFRSVLHKAEDMDAIMAWFKEKAGVTDEEIAAAEAKEKEYVAGCLMLAKQYLGMGHCISGKTYLELAAAKGSEEAIAQLKDMEYAEDMIGVEAGSVIKLSIGDQEIPVTVSGLFLNDGLLWLPWRRHPHHPRFRPERPGFRVHRSQRSRVCLHQGADGRR